MEGTLQCTSSENKDVLLFRPSSQTPWIFQRVQLKNPCPSTAPFQFSSHCVPFTFFHLYTPAATIVVQNLVAAFLAVAKVLVSHTYFHLLPRDREFFWRALLTMLLPCSNLPWLPLPRGLNPAFSGVPAGPSIIWIFIPNNLVPFPSPKCQLYKLFSNLCFSPSILYPHCFLGLDLCPKSSKILEDFLQVQSQPKWPLPPLDSLCTSPSSVTTFCFY